MAKKQKKTSTVAGQAPLGESARANVEETQKSSATKPNPRRVWFLRLAALCAPLVLLLALEGLLRVMGFGYPTAFFLHWKAGETNLCVNNPRFGKRFFPPALETEARGFAFPEHKNTNTVRVFVLGESAALGDPDPKFGFRAMLQALLRERYPQRRFEVINTSMVAINSHVILPIARECAVQQGDVWVIYMGNNEMVGPFGAATILGAKAPPLAAVRTSLALKTTRTGQLFDSLIQKAQTHQRPQAEWKAMEMFQDQKIRYDDPRTARIYASFQQNLEDILRAGKRAGARILLCTVATNLKDCGPFASMHRSGLAENQLAEWQAAFERGAKAESSRSFEEALAAYTEAEKIDPSFAELQFRMASCHLATGHQKEAQACFQLARDYDALQFRTDSRLNAIIRKSAAAHATDSVRLVDTEQFMAQASPQGVAGREFFYEHVHMTPEGNYVVARALAEELAATLGLNSSGTDSAKTWIAREECLQHLGFGDRNRYDCLTSVLDLVRRPPFIGQSHTNLLRNVEAELEQLRPATKTSRLKSAVPAVRAAVSRDPTDPELHRNLADLLERISDLAGAEAEWRQILGIWPHAASACFHVGRLLEMQGHQGQAKEFFLQSLQRDPDYVPAHERLGLMLAGSGDFAEAIPHFETALRFRPSAVNIRLAKGHALIGLRKYGPAEKELKVVLQLEPTNADAKRLLESLPRR